MEKIMRILCIPYTHTMSHLSRALLVSKELRNRGHVVQFAGESSKDKFIREEKFDVIPLYQIEPEVLFGRIGSGKLKFVERCELEKMIEADHHVYDKFKPDVVLTDGRFSAPISTGIARIPHVAIVNVSSTAYRANPYIPIFDWIPKFIILRDRIDKLNLFLEMLVFDQAVSVFKKLSKKYKLKRTICATNCLTGNDLTLLADIPEYFPSRDLPCDYHYIGPLTWKSCLAPPSWWPIDKNGKIVVYISMGTTWMGGSFDILCRLVKDENLIVIVTTGGQISNEQAKRLTEENNNLYVEDFVDGDLVMEICDVVLCHGGNGTIYQALSHGKPVIGNPTIPDQDFNMRRVEVLGLGEKISQAQLTGDTEFFGKFLERVAGSDRYNRNSTEMKNKLNKLNPSGNAADLIEKYFCM